tara:strand:+ start:456 stop:1241 length:786 start_codon:yes stop_codon:yes gene_type:complete
MEDIKKYLKIVESRGVLGAEDGGLTLFINDENIELGKTPEEVAEKLKGINDLDLDDLFASSSVDFADEYGFENEDDAHELFDKAVALMIPKPDDRARDKVDDRPATSDDIAKINKGEEPEMEEDINEGCGDDSCPTCGGDPEDMGPPEPEEQESHKYEKHHSTETGSVSVEASADSIDELKVLLRKVGITLPSGEPHGDDDHDDDHDDKGPMKIVSLSPEPEMDGDKPTMDFPKTAVDPDSKEVLTNILKDRLKDYLRNGK